MKQCFTCGSDVEEGKGIPNYFVTFADDEPITAEALLHAPERAVMAIMCPDCDSKMKGVMWRERHPDETL